MANEEFSKKYADNHNSRFVKTLKFMEPFVNTKETILDIGPVNPMSKRMQSLGFQVDNTGLTDLDLEFDIVKDDKYDVVTAFEIFEHLVSPFPLLKAVRAKKLLASIPLRLWFATAYWNDNDPYDCHYHEFEPKQFDMLLNKAGWEIEASEKWTEKSGKFGIRPLLRTITPRHYIVYCTRKS